MATSNMMDNITSEIICSICLDLFQDPVVLECEHYFCRSCISQFWSKMKGDTSCPECRHVSARRHLKSVRVLANIVERVRLLMPGDEEKDSLCCQEHGHGLGDRLKMYCQDDQKAICVDCWSSKHQLHRIKPIKEATSFYTQKLKLSLESLEPCLAAAENVRLQEEADIKSIDMVFEALSSEIHAEFERVHVFLYKREEQMREELQREVTQRLKTLHSSLQSTTEEVAGLRRTRQEITARLTMRPPTMLQDIDVFLRRCELPVPRSAAAHTTIAALPAHVPHGDLKFLQVWGDLRGVFSPAVTPFTFDPDTAHHNLVLSEDLMAVRCSEEGQQLPDLPGRFNVKLYVLGSRGFSSGRHYWEVSVGGKTAWVLGVCKESASRKGDFRRKPETGFWLVCLSGEQTYAALDAAGTALSLTIKPRKLGIHLDYECGCISFYDADLCCHLYTFTDSFTERLFPIFCPSNNYSGQNEEPLTLCL